MPTECRPSHQNDVVLLLVVQGFDLQRDGLADGIAEHGEALRFFVEEQVYYRLRREDTKLTRVELSCLTRDLAQDLVAHCLRGFHFATSLAHRTRLAQGMREAFAR